MNISQVQYNIYSKQLINVTRSNNI